MFNVLISYMFCPKGIDQNSSSKLIWLHESWLTAALLLNNGNISFCEKNSSFKKEFSHKHFFIIIILVRATGETHGLPYITDQQDYSISFIESGWQFPQSSAVTQFYITSH